MSGAIILQVLRLFAWTGILMFTCTAATTFNHPPAHRNQVTVTGNLDKAKIKTMVNYYVRYWKLNKLHILVKFTNRLPRGFKGYAQYAENKDWDVQQVIIRINTKHTPKEQFLTLAHEMVHVKQFSRKELVYHGGLAYTWKNHHCEDVSKIAYNKRSWEKEAFDLEEKLYQAYQKEQ